MLITAASLISPEQQGLIYEILRFHSIRLWYTFPALNYSGFFSYGKERRKAQGEKLFEIFRIFAYWNEFSQISKSCKFQQNYANSLNKSYQTRTN